MLKRQFERVAIDAAARFDILSKEFKDFPSKGRKDVLMNEAARLEGMIALQAKAIRDNLTDIIIKNL